MNDSQFPYTYKSVTSDNWNSTGSFSPKNQLKICHFKRERRHLCLKSCTVNSKSKGKNNVVNLATSRSMQSATLKDQTSKPQILKFHDLRWCRQFILAQ